MNCVHVHPCAVVFGLHPICGNVPQEMKPYKTLTYLNVAGWFPFIGIIVGACRIKHAIQQIDKIKQEAQAKGNQANADSLTLLKTMVVRGIAEILFLGILLMLVDVVITVVRHFFPWKPSQQNKDHPSSQQLNQSYLLV